MKRTFYSGIILVATILTSIASTVYAKTYNCPSIEMVKNAMRTKVGATDGWTMSYQGLKYTASYNFTLKKNLINKAWKFVYAILNPAKDVGSPSAISCLYSYSPNDDFEYEFEIWAGKYGQGHRRLRDIVSEKIWGRSVGHNQHFCGPGQSSVRLPQGCKFRLHIFGNTPLKHN